MLKYQMKQPKKTSIFIVIPARFASTRLPGKPLLKIGSKTMIVRVVERATLLAENLKRFPWVQNVKLILATDNQDIYDETKNLNCLALMTSENLKNGTERVYQACEHLKEKTMIKCNDLVINIQGDEPFFSIDDVRNLVVKMYKNKDTPMGTMAFLRKDPHLFFSSSVVKVVCDAHNNALYFSRAPVPFPKDILGATGAEWLHKMAHTKGNIEFLHHVGIYIFRFSALTKFVKELKGSKLENTENLEQLRALEAGWKIVVTLAKNEPFGIDTKEDLLRAQNMVGHYEN